MMKEFYYQLKTRDNEGYWSYHSFFKGIVEAETSQKAREHIKKEILDKDIKKGDDVLLSIIEVKEDTQYLKDFFKPRICKKCGASFSFANNEYYGDYCCRACYDEAKTQRYIEEAENYYSSDFSVSYPVIYRIHDRKNDKNYIGQTIRAFTLRWWEHYKSWIPRVENTSITDFEFTVLEVLPKDVSKEKLTEREQFYIKKYDSIENGYNSINAQAEGN